jgi:hypothetical protein
MIGHPGSLSLEKDEMPTRDKEQKTNDIHHTCVCSKKNLAQRG